MIDGNKSEMKEVRDKCWHNDYVLNALQELGCDCNNMRSITVTSGLKFLIY